MLVAKPPEFRRRAVDLVRRGDSPVAQIAKDLGISESCLRRWVAIDDVDSGGGRASAATNARSWSSCAAVTGCWRWRTRSSSARVPTSRGRTSSRIGFRLVQELAADGFDVAVTCRVLGVSRSGYYEWRGRGPSQRDLEDAYLASQIRDIHAASRATYGAPRVGFEHLVRRRFVADAPDRLWCTDVTEHPIGTGKVYCAAVLDVYSRRIVGWSIADHIRSELVVDALQMASWNRQPKPGTILHPTAAASTRVGSSGTGCAKPACSAPWAASPAQSTTQ